LTPPTKFSCRPIANGTHWLHQNCSPVSQLETGLTDVNRRKVVLFVNYFFFFCLYFFPCFLHSSLIAFFHLWFYFSYLLFIHCCPSLACLACTDISFHS
jgi:hypothetical protein